jgi:hypothetical protein
LEDISETFHLLTAHSRAVQRTAYTILHRYIPHAQEKVSFEVALSKTAVSLPDELVSLLLEPPTMQMVSAGYGDDKMWTSMRAYLLSWKVVFDHFSNAVSFDSSLTNCKINLLTVRPVAPCPRVLHIEHQREQYPHPTA